MEVKLPLKQQQFHSSTLDQLVTREIDKEFFKCVGNQCCFHTHKFKVFVIVN